MVAMDQAEQTTALKIDLQFLLQAGSGNLRETLTSLKPGIVAKEKLILYNSCIPLVNT